jgi:hypothetical protein
MSFAFRRLAAGAIAGLALSVLASSPAFAASRPNTSTWPAPLTTAHFMVHRKPYVSADDAQKVADDFEAAYATEVGSWGYSPPLDDGDGLIDVYVGDPNVDYPVIGARRDDDTATTSSGFAVLSADPAMTLDLAGTAANQLFQLVQYSMFTGGSPLLQQGTAEWAAANVTGRTVWSIFYWANPSQPLDCAGQCADSSVSRWIFFEYLSERYGTGIVKEIYQRVAALQADTAAAGLDAIDAVLGAHGSSLAQAFNDFSAANASGAYTFPGQAGKTNSLKLSQGVLTGVNSFTQLDSWKLDHLSTSYVPIVSGDGRAKLSNCGAATLHLTVKIPAGVQSQPSFVDGSGLHRLSLSGNTASASLPWTNCDGTRGTLVLPNASRAVDAAQFAVVISIDVVPPEPLAGTAAPKIRLLHLPGRATVGRKRPYLTFAVRSSGAGTLGVLLKARYVRGSFHLHAGTNKLKLRLPRGYRGGRPQIVFTAYSTTGARGTVLKRHIAIRIAH